MTSPHHVRFTPNNGRWTEHPKILAVCLWVHALVHGRLKRRSDLGFRALLFLLRGNLIRNFDFALMGLLQ